MNNLGVIYPEAMKDSIEVLDIHGPLFLFRIVKIELWDPLLDR